MRKNISLFFEQDHDQLDEYFHRFQELKHSDYQRAKEYFRQFKSGLQRHILWEDDVLFRVFEQKTGLTEGPTMVMRREHILIKKALEDLHSKVRRMDPDSAEEEKVLGDLLSVHNEKEEKILYPAIDEMLSEEERSAVYARLESIPAETYQT